MRIDYATKDQYGKNIDSNLQSLVDPLHKGTYRPQAKRGVTASKDCDLIPFERYVQMAARGGLSGQLPHSLFELNHHFARFRGQYT